jgi:hypothetical protein
MIYRRVVWVLGALAVAIIVPPMPMRSRRRSV